MALIWQDIEAKRKATRYLHEPPLLIEDNVAGDALPEALSA